MKDILIATITWLFFFLVQLAGIVLGLIVVPLGLIFRKKDSSTEKPFTTFNTHRNWVYEDLPKWLEPWQNIEDGLRGDHRGWWDANSFGEDSSKPFNMFWWSAIRNPFNYFKRFVIGCDVRDYTFTKLAGQEYVRDDLVNTGWQFLKATPTKKSGKWFPRYMFYLVKQYGISERALVIQIGNKIKLEHNGVVEADEYDYWKGFTAEFNPFKSIA